MKALDPLEARRRVDALVVLDARDEEAFARGHLAGSGNLPRQDLQARRAELPPRGAELLVVAEDASGAAEAAAVLESLGYREVAFLDAPLAALPAGLADRAPALRLWRPAPFLEEVLPLLGIAEPAGAPPSDRLTASPPGRSRDGGAPRAGPRRALDLASGSGRDAVFLGLRGLEVEAWDHAPEALARARDLARRHGVTLRTVVCDLEQRDLPLPERPFDLITCFRFLHRPLFPWIERALAPGGWLVYETYRLGQERFGRPKRAHFLLERGELADAFPGLVTVRYQELEPQGGPITARLLASKPEEA